jgi:hypothetical protein
MTDLEKQAEEWLKNHSHLQGSHVLKHSIILAFKDGHTAGAQSERAKAEGLVKVLDLFTKLITVENGKEQMPMPPRIKKIAREALSAYRKNEEGGKSK